ncbi:hypothetical protein TWF106_001245 [Orbilia oligospora]|uniref:Uncharacterized protein n=1 Tax=Orbilia oligospora TaxID=2813651 RepID=A0A7C8QVY3_ORBOL|nr:hypothetical protein TWF106_001245 [Orbilia oligospora]
MKALSIFRTFCCAAIAVGSCALAAPMESLEAEHHLTKRMLSASKAANYFGGFLLVPRSELSSWTTENAGLLNSYLVFSRKVREETTKLKTEPYVALLRAYSSRYAKQMYPDNPLAFISWQEFVNEGLIKALHRPWGEKWKLPEFALSPDDRLKGLSAELLKVYPHAEIENEEDFNDRPLLRSAKITTVEYVAEFSLPFPSISSLSDWLFDPRPPPDEPGQVQDDLDGLDDSGSDDPLFIELDRRERIEVSLRAIYSQLGALVEDLRGFNLQVQLTGNIPIPPENAQPIIKIIKETIDGWERLKDLVGVLATTMRLLKETLE